MANPNIILKLLVDKKDQRVLFAETTKEFVDFLFHIFSLPLGTLIELLGSKQMVGCLGKLKESVEIFHDAYLQPGVVKDDIFNPKTTFNGNMLLLTNDASMDHKPQTPKTFYTCSYSSRYGRSHSSDDFCSLQYVSEYHDAGCPGCRRLMDVRLTSVGPPNKDEAVVKEAEAEGKKEKVTGGYVKEVATYMVMDNLVVKPMSTIASITLINSFGVKDLSQLEEKTLSFGKDEALKLLKASLVTEQVLTTLFRDTDHA